MSILRDWYQSQWFLLTIIFLAIWIFVTSETMYLYFAHGQEWNTTGQIEQDIHNFTRTAQNGTQYICQENSAGQVLGCSPISNNTTQQIEQNHTKIGTLMKYKGHVYCYDETTTSRKEVLDAIKHDYMSQVMELENKFFTSLVKDNAFGWEMAVTGCQNMVAQGSIDNEDYHDEPIELEGTLTLKVK